jgi:hypothetical protein
MLFQVIMSHSEDNCPSYHRDKMPEVLEAFKNLDALGEKLNVKQHYFVWCPPNHIAFLLLESDSLNSVSRYVFSIPFPHDTQIIPVEHLQETVAMAKAMIEQ